MAAGEASQASACLLVVDDEEALRQLLASGLKRQGFAVVVAADGREALGILDGGQSVDLVLTDIVMPRLTGLELCSEMVRRFPEIPVLLMTGCIDQPPSDWGLEVPILRKPFRLSCLCEAIRSCLRGLPPVPVRPWPSAGSVGPGEGPSSR
jgi:two-component system cell cycle sensor histidine kinase/response regulator CckA